MLGQAELTLYAKSSSPNTDFFARLCDVSPSGQSINIADALVRVTPENPERDGNDIMKLTITMHHCAHRFRRGNKLRLQVSSGAHPRFARNLGTGEPIGSARRMVVQYQTIYFDSAHPSRLILPVIDLA